MAGHFLLTPEARNFTLADVERLSEEQVHALFAQQRWGAYGDNKQVCPACASIESHYVVHGRHQWRCKAVGCGHTFSVTTGTKFQDHKLPLKKILQALVLYLTAVKGISASQMARTVGVAYQTAFTLLHKLREGLLNARNLEPLECHVELDGAHFSGRIRKPRVITKASKTPARSKQGKTSHATHRNRRIVMVLREISPIKGNGAIRTIVEVVRSENETHVKPLARRYIKPGALVHTDEHPAYSSFYLAYQHETVNHSVEFSTDQGVNENQAESFFARARRMVIGQVHRVTPKYMLDYMNEVAWREDVRRIGTRNQMAQLLDACLLNGESKWWRGYWQGHHREDDLAFKNPEAPSATTVTLE